ncbi:hypothetical protein ADK38_35780, partial [Streptomyces varsoviensis]
MGREAGGDEVDQFVVADAVGDHVGDDLLPEVLVRDADDGRLAHRRVVEQGVLHLARADPVAARLDQVGGGAADDAVRAVGLDGRDVARTEPAVGREGGG